MFTGHGNEKTQLIMKTKKNNKICQSLALMACALLPALASCDRLNDGVDNGTKSAVHFSAGDLEPWGAETLVRGASAGSQQIEAASVALGDNWVLEANLLEEPAPAIRKEEDLGKGIIMRVIARNASKKVVAEKDYVHLSNGNFQPGPEGPIELDAGSRYSFMVYSYNTSDDVAVRAVPRNLETTVTFNPYADGDNSNDLILGTVEETAGNGITFPKLKHQFSRAKYKVVLPASGVELTDIKVLLANNYKARLTKENDLPEPDVATSPQPLSDGPDHTDYRIVYTGNDSGPVLNISGTLKNLATNKTTSFKNLLLSYTTPLAAGRSYILQINIKKGLTWAASNIYWDGNQLTFKEYDFVVGTGKENNYQGVFFRWGSLVGIDPSPAGGTAWDPSGNVLYIPLYNANDKTNSQWKKENETTKKTWDSKHDGNIPYVNVNAGTLSDDSDNLSGAADYANKKGDICRYLSDIGAVKGKYRMPTMNELFIGSKGGSATIKYEYAVWESTTAVSGYWTRIGSTSSSPSDWNDISTTATNAAGTYTDLKSGANYSAYATFPAAGWRNVSDGTVSFVGNMGYYWSSSFYNLENARYLKFSATGVPTPASGAGRRYGFSVRCLLDD
jgi:hypothetical protein